MTDQTGNEIPRWIGRKIVSLWQELSGWAKSLTLIKWIFWFALIALSLELFTRWQPAVRPFKTLGEIYLDSPEVYTRERLVNDRYDQDHWLRKKLEELDSATNFVSRQQVGMGSAQIAQDGQAAPAAPEITPFASGGTELTYRHEFQIQNDIRAELRQRILENLLDDRHDLSGNSLYGFKFDTTVVTGTNTRDTAFVRLRLIANTFNDLRVPVEGDVVRPATIGDFIFASVEDAHPLRTEFDVYEELYVDWLSNIESRLNHYVANARLRGGPANCTGANFERTITNVLGSVLSINRDETSIAAQRAKEGFGGGVNAIAPMPVESARDEAEDTSIAERYTVTFEKPWGALIEMIVWPGPGRECLREMRFSVEPVKEVYFLFKSDGTRDWELPEWATRLGMVMTFNVDDANMFAASLATRNDISRFDPKLNPHYPDRFFASYVEDADQQVAGGSESVRKFCQPEPGADPNNPVALADCADENSYYPIVVHSGVLNLIDRLSRQDAYSYAILPESNATGVLKGYSGEAGFGGGAEGMLGQVGLAFGIRSADTETPIVGFSDSSRSRDGSIEFGWVLDPSISGRHLQSDQMALVSVPGSINEVRFEVTRGWMNRNGEVMSQEEPYSIKVALPPDFEAFETIIFNRSDNVRRQPVIFDRFFERDAKRETVYVCRENRILIPGRRLWRSTEVTLGALQADRIVVMPNMEGIIAVFDNLPSYLVRPAGGPDPEVEGEQEEGTGLTLRVWTSEGVAESSRSFIPAFPHGTQESCP